MANSKGKILFILNPGLGHVTVYLRGLIFKNLLELNGWEPTYVNFYKEKYNSELDKLYKSEDEIVDIAKKHDIIYLLKVNSLCFIKRLKFETNSKLVFELTDALWRSNFLFNGWHNLKSILKISDAVFSENEYVCDFGRRYNGNVYSLVASTQIEKFDLIRKEIKSHEDDKVVLGWIGSSKTISAIYSIIDQLEKLFENYPFLELRILGCDSKILAGPLKNLRYTSVASYNEDDMIREALNMDVGLFPAPSDLDDYRIRGALKGLIYMSAGIPPVCLNVGDLSKIIRDGQNGILINSSSEWYSKIEQLVISKGKRKKIGENAYNTIKSRHTLNRAFSDLENALLNVMNMKLERKVIVGLQYRLLMNLCFLREFIIKFLIKIYKKIGRQELQKI